MKDIAGQAEKIMMGLDRSQDELEEMAFELLNAVDHVRKHNDELFDVMERVLEEDSKKSLEVAMQELHGNAVKIERAMSALETLVHKNEEVCSEQRKNIEEAKQAVDFLYSVWLDN